MLEQQNLDEAAATSTVNKDGNDTIVDDTEHDHNLHMNLNPTVELAKKEVMIKLQSDALTEANYKVRNLLKQRAEQDALAVRQSKTIEELQQLLLKRLQQLVEANDKIRQLTLERTAANKAAKAAQIEQKEEKFKEEETLSQDENKKQSSNFCQPLTITTTTSTSNTIDATSTVASTTTNTSEKTEPSQSTTATSAAAASNTPPVSKIKKKKRPPARKRPQSSPTKIAPPSTKAASPSTIIDQITNSSENTDEHDTTTWWSQETVDELQLKIQTLQSTVHQLEQEKQEQKEEIHRLENIMQEMTTQIYSAVEADPVIQQSLMYESSADEATTTDDDDSNSSDDDDDHDTGPQHALPPGHTLLLLISSMPASPKINQQQRYLTTILQGLQLSHEYYQLLDGCDVNIKGLRDDLFRISGLQAVYPQLFLVQQGIDLVFVGDYDAVVELHDRHLLQKTLGLVELKSGED